MAMLQMQDRALCDRIGNQTTARGGNRFAAGVGPVIVQENILKTSFAARQLVEDEGSVASLHEHAFLGEIENFDMAGGEQNRAIGITGMGLQPTEDNKRQGAD